MDPPFEKASRDRQTSRTRSNPGSTVRKLSGSLPTSYKTWVAIFYTTDFIFAVLYGFLEPLLESAKDVFRNCMPGQKSPIG